MWHTCILFHHWRHHQASMSLRELWIVLHTMIIGTPWLVHQMLGPCKQCNLLISIIAIGHTCPILMLNPTAITSSQESLLEQGLHGLMVIANVEHPLFLHLTSVMGKLYLSLVSCAMTLLWKYEILNSCIVLWEDAPFFSKMNLNKQWKPGSLSIYHLWILLKNFLCIFLDVRLVPLPRLHYSIFLCLIFTDIIGWENKSRKKAIFATTSTIAIQSSILFISVNTAVITFFLFADLVPDLDLPMFLLWCLNSWGLMAASANSTNKIHLLAYLLGHIGQEACDLPQHLYQRTSPFPCSRRVHLAIVRWRLMTWEGAGSTPGSVTGSPRTRWCPWTARQAGGPHSSSLIAHQSLHPLQGGCLGNGSASAGRPLKIDRPRALRIGKCTHRGCRPSLLENPKLIWNLSCL